MLVPISQIPSLSSYQGVSVPGEVTIISEALTSITSISGVIYSFIFYSNLQLFISEATSLLIIYSDYRRSVIGCALGILDEARYEIFVIGTLRSFKEV